MIRKMLVVAAAAAMPITAVAASGGFASAAVPKVNATTYTVACNTIAATAKFSPALTTAGAAVSDEATSIKGTASGCVATPSVGGTPITIADGAKISGTIHDATSDHKCGGLIVPTSETGTLTIKWKTGVGSPKLLSGTSITNPTTVTGGAGGDGHATFSLGFAAATSGPFQGSDGGTTSTNSAETTTTVGAILASCSPPAKGLKSIAITKNTNVGAPANALVLQ